MGLDMYLEVEERYYNSPFKAGEKIKIEYPRYLKALGDAIHIRNFTTKVEKNRYQVGYWRKFNALHKFIVDNFADGVDDCRDIYLDKEDISLILSTLKAVNKNKEMASELMPTQEGFFFGSNNYDEWYFEDVEYSIDLFEKVLKLFDTFEAKESADYNWEHKVIYNASW